MWSDWQHYFLADRKCGIIVNIGFLHGQKCGLMGKPAFWGKEPWSNGAGTVIYSASILQRAFKCCPKKN